MHPRYVVHQRAIRTAAAAGWPQGMFRGLGDNGDGSVDYSDLPTTTYTTPTELTVVDPWAGTAGPTSNIGLTVTDPNTGLQVAAADVGPGYPSTLPTTGITTGTTPAAAPGGATAGSASWQSVINNAIASMSKIGTILALPQGSVISPTGGISLGSSAALTQLGNTLSQAMPFILNGGLMRRATSVAIADENETKTFTEDEFRRVMRSNFFVGMVSFWRNLERLASPEVRTAFHALGVLQECAQSAYADCAGYAYSLQQAECFEYCGLMPRGVRAPGSAVMEKTSC